MSLVHDALQKAEREKLRKTGLVGPVVTQSGRSGVPAAKSAVGPVAAGTPLLPPEDKVTPTPRRLSFLPLFIAVLIVVAVGVLAWVVLHRQPGGGPSRAGGIAASDDTPTTTALTEQRPPAEPATPPATDDAAYKLTGIMKDPDGKPCAIVNGRVVYEGHFVDGATVKRIERDRVALEVNGREVVKRLY